MNLLEMTGISKSFFGVKVLNNVSLKVRPGTVHALLGENGAGKSTLMNILGGVYTKDSGEVFFDGELLENITINSSEKAGIAFVHQELNFFNDLTVYENIFLCNEKTKFGCVNRKEMIKETVKLFNELGVDISPKALVGELNTSKKQLLEIIKALHKKAKLIILDEPTTALSNEEVTHLFSIINRLKKEGISFIFISHKMPEIFQIADDYTVLRNGNFISTGSISDVNPLELTKDITGQHYNDAAVYKQRNLGETVLKVENLSGKGFSNVNLELRRGEIVGITGLQGAGSSEFIQALFGANEIKSGEVYVNGELVKNVSISSIMKHKVGMVPANRKENSIIPDMNLQENNSLAHYQLSKNPFINYNKEKNQFDYYKNKLNIKCNNKNDLIVSLSGGNQQKVILGRWLYTDSDILLLDNPTQGIDVGAKAEIYKLIMELSEMNKTIIINTLEINEIQKVADRCCVFYHGQIEKILPHEEIDESVVMMYATNAHKVLVD